MDWLRDHTRRIIAILAALTCHIHGSRRGSVAIIMAITLPVALGMLALGSEIVFLLYKQRQMQSAADAAALGGATAVQSGHPAPDVEARGTTGFLGFVHGANGVTVAVNRPPLTGALVGSNSAVEVIITQPQTLSLVSLFRSGLFSVSARAVAKVGGGGGCAAQLLPNRNPGVTISNGATVTLKQCDMRVCSTGNTALSMSGGTHLNLTDAAGILSSKQTVFVAGKASITNGAQINNVGSCSSPTCKASQGACAANLDPYANVTMPAPPSACGAGFSNNKQYAHGTWSLKPTDGMYCNGVRFTNDAIVTMAPGVYFVKGGNFNVGGAVIMNATGVTIVLTGSGSNYATVTIGNGARVTLSAPTTGATAGLAFFGDRNAPWSSQAAKQQTFGGGAYMNITGAIYFPSTQVNFNNGISNPSGCTQLIAGTINFQGGAQFSNNCAGMGTSPIGSSGVTTLME